jgi:hypothetical protein
MGSFIERLAAGPETLLWLDYACYAGALLAGGEAPWLDAAACIAWERKAQSLLRSDVISVPIEAICSGWLENHPALRAEMAAKSRVVYALKTLLAAEMLRRYLIEFAHALRTTFAGLTLALVCPSPKRWIAAAHGQACGDSTRIDIGEDEVDSATLYVADFLRAFRDCGVNVLLLQESVESEPASAQDVAAYRAALNVAANYHWDAGLHVPGIRFPPSLAADVAFLISPRPISGLPAGQEIPREFWQGAPAPDSPAGGFRFARIPADAVPETVLQRLALLR